MSSAIYELTKNTISLQVQINEMSEKIDWLYKKVNGDKPKKGEGEG